MQVSGFDYHPSVPTSFKGLDFERTMDVSCVLGTIIKTEMTHMSQRIHMCSPLEALFFFFEKTLEAFYAVVFVFKIRFQAQIAKRERKRKKKSQRSSAQHGLTTQKQR